MAPALPPFFDHAAKGALFGGLVGGSIAVVGWVVRQRNETVIDLGVDAPTILAAHRPLAEALLHFKDVSHHSATTRALYTQLVRNCESVVEQEDATGAAQVVVQKRVTEAVACAKRLAREAFRFRDPHAHDCRTQIEHVQGHLAGVQKNMMMA